MAEAGRPDWSVVGSATALVSRGTVPADVSATLAEGVLTRLAATGAGSASVEANTGLEAVVVSAVGTAVAAAIVGATVGVLVGTWVGAVVGVAVGCGVEVAVAAT
jgi:hypothetical protein